MSSDNPRSQVWLWSVCGLLLAATMLNYMDRQTLSLTITDISRELQLSATHYGRIEEAFGYAFACGGLLIGFLADRLSVRWMYPAVLVGWSLAGIATAHSVEMGEWLIRHAGGWLRPPEEMTSDGYAGYVGLIACRSALGFFEAGHWPCALVTTQRVLSQRGLTLGNSVLQSGASIGAILTPPVVLAMVSDVPGTWKGPFQLIGFLGMFWIVPWLALMRGRDLALPSTTPGSASPAGGDPRQLREHRGLEFWRRFLVLIVVVIAINATWQFFRAWLPKFLREYHDYEREAVNYFVMAYYVATDVGCIAVGIAVRQLAVRGWSVHGARMLTFTACALLTALSVQAALLPRGPLLLGMLLVIGAGCLGLFPNYYSFTQELSARRQGLITGSLGFVTWMVSANVQVRVGQSVDATGSYQQAIMWLGLAPLVGLIALALFWPRGTR
jgi:ACS family hexuronate transporter-like MFS transporter